MAKYKPVYSYRFDQPPAGTTIEYGTTHFAEVAYVFSNPLPTVNPLPTRPGDAELANAMTRYWVNFVHDGNPNYAGMWLLNFVLGG
jgi:acetylcholinesterase